MGNTSSAEERQEQRRTGVAGSARHRHRGARDQRSYTEPADSSDSDDWEMIGREAPQQMPSQQYYPTPWIHQLDNHTRRPGREFSSTLASSARPGGLPDWKDVGVAVGAGLAVGLADIVGRTLQKKEERQRQQLRESGERRESEEEDGQEEEGSALPSAPPMLPPPVQTDSAAGGPLPLPTPPKVCYRHPGCSDPDCDRLHLCLLFLADLCRLGHRCRRGHSLTTVHNQLVCDRHRLDTRRESECLALLRVACEESGRFPISLYRDNLSICFFMACAGTCNSLHICRRWVTEDCSRPVCKFGHDLNSLHNRAVLLRHKMERGGEAAIRALLREKYTHLAPKGAAATADVGEGRSRQQQQQQQQQEASRGAAAAAGAFSEELQCAICLELFDKATTLGCGHTFCANCVGAVARCPLCRADITTFTRSVTLDSIISSLTTGH